jgi:hypothetical protein
MDETLITAGIFLLGAGSGAALSYLKDRRMLRLYGDLVRQLSAALRRQWGPAPVPPAAGALIIRAHRATRE